VAVAIEFVSVIIHKTAVETRFPGGLDAFARQDLPNFTEDEHILRVGFMSTSDALDFAETIASLGLRDFGNTDDSDVAILAGSESKIPEWLTIGVVDQQSACWASEFPPGELFASEPGLLFECSREMYETIEALLAVRGISLTPLPPEPAHSDRFRCVRESGDVVLEVFDPGPNVSRIGLWIYRDFSRRQMAGDDIRLMREVKAILEAKQDGEP